MFWLLRTACVRLERVVRLSKNVNPIYAAGVLMLQCSLALFIAVLTPIAIRILGFFSWSAMFYRPFAHHPSVAVISSLRRLALPSSIRSEVELNLVFNTCGSELHGICSFPSAIVEYEKASLFSPSVTYTLSVRLRFADIEPNQKLGVFQNILSFYDGDQLLQTFSKSAYVKQPSFIIKMLHIIFFPLHFLGLFHDYSLLEIPLTFTHLETYSKLSTKLVYQLQDRFVQVDKAFLIIDARFGIIRHLLYNWPVTTFALIFISTFSACCFAIILFWSAKSVVKFTSNDCGKNSAIKGNAAKSSCESSGYGSDVQVTEDEFIPDNVDEVPHATVFGQIPGWYMELATDVPVAAHDLRRRK